MHTVVTINLNGQAYQLDEDAFEALRAYLDRAETQLRDNPDRTEILADLEQAIADKCQRYLNPHKTVVGASEIAQVLEEMGPVDTGTPGTPETGSGEPASGGNRPRAEAGAPRRLYRIMQGAMIGGVCNGIAAFFDIDVTFVRAALVALAVLELAASHSGLVIVLYFVMMLVVPGASTSEEQAAARGAPFNAQEVIHRAKRNVGAFKDHDWREQKREWRRQHREWRRRWRDTIRAERWAWSSSSVPPAGSYGTRIAAGALMPVLAVASLVLLAFLMYGLITLISTGTVYAWRVPGEVPIWVAMLALVLIYNAFAWPLHAARRASYHVLGGPYVGWWYAAGDGLLSVGFAILLLWFGYQHVPAVREFIQRLPAIWENLRDAASRS
jgi:phage shock protein PspC (stress-responsive transcriptional regulator)